METTSTDGGRKERGLEIAARLKITRQGQGWSVPSQTSGTRYTVTGLPTEATLEAARCSCPDYETRMLKCKHIWAVEYVIQRETNPDGTTTVTERLTVTETVEQKTYRQDWPAYNQAQTTEGDLFPALLRDLCRDIPEPEQQRGRPRATLADSVFCATLKVYSTLSTRRFMSDLRAAQERGHIAKAPHLSSVFRYLEDPALTPILYDLIVRSSLPLKAVEVDFAVDSSGFSSARMHSWFEHRYGNDMHTRQRDWVKVHIACGVKTNIVTAVEIHGPRTSDSPQLPSLVATTARNFAVAEVSADKAYGSIRNANAITNAGGQPFIVLKRNTTGEAPRASSSWTKMVGYFIYRRDEFLTHYHKRSNVETTFSMMKRKFGDFVRSKTDTAMTNEVLCKVLCHNIVVVIHEAAELGITAELRTQPAA